MGLSDRSFLKRRVGKPDSRARGGIHTWFGRFVLARFFSPHLRRLREFVWVGGCVTVPVAWAQVRAPWHHGGHGAVYVVGPVTPPGRASPVLSPVARVRAPAGSACPQGQECTQIGENGLLELFWTICVHCCAVVDRRGDAGVYTDWRKWPLGAVLGHSCTLLRREDRTSCDASCDAHCVGWHERLNCHGAPAAPPR